LASYWINDIDGTVPRSRFPLFSTFGTFWKLHLTSHQWNKLTAGRSQVTPKVLVHDLAGCGIDDIDGTMSMSPFPIFSTNGTFPKSHVSIFSTHGTFWKLCLTSHHWNSFHLDTQAAWDLLSEAVKAIILGLLKDPATCSLNDLGDPTAQGDLQVHALLGEQPILLQGIHHELVDMAKLDSASADVFELDNVLWMNPCLLLANSLPVAHAIAKLRVSGKSIAMAAKLFASDPQSSASAFDLSLPLST